MTDEQRPAWLGYHNNSVGGREYVNPTTRAAEHERGLLFMAPWEDPFSGFPEHSRRLVRSLAEVGEVVRLRALRGSFDFGAGINDLDMQRARDALRKQLEPQLKASVKTVDVQIVMTVPDDAMFMRFAPSQHHWMEQHELAYSLSKMVISTVFERDRVSPQGLDALKRVGQVWVANRQDRAMLIGQGLDEARVHRIPIPFMPDDPHLALPAERMPGPTRFYHIGKWEPRKEQRNILLAFLLAFEPGPDSPKLYLKTSAKGPKLESGYPESPGEAIERCFEEPLVTKRGWTWDNINEHVFVIQRRLSEAQMLGLHRQGDVYVTLSRGEGYDMPAFDSKLSGNLMVYTPSGGPEDFARSDDVLVPATGTVPCDPFYRWGDARYLDYDVVDAAEALQRADDIAQRRDAAAQRHPPPQAWGSAAVGAKMRDALEAIRHG